MIQLESNSQLQMTRRSVKMWLTSDTLLQSIRLLLIKTEQEQHKRPKLAQFLSVKARSPLNGHGPPCTAWASGIQGTKHFVLLWWTWSARHLPLGEQMQHQLVPLWQRCAAGCIHLSLPHRGGPCAVAEVGRSPSYPSERQCAVESVLPTTQIE